MLVRLVETTGRIKGPVKYISVPVLLKMVQTCCASVVLRGSGVVLRAVFAGLNAIVSE
jgi:hypothetical protein